MQATATIKSLPVATKLVKVLVLGAGQVDPFGEAVYQRLVKVVPFI